MENIQDLAAVSVSAWLLRYGLGQTFDRFMRNSRIKNTAARLDSF